VSPGEAVDPDASPEAEPGFAHASEAELARILDFYAVHWEYEPHTFPILWSLDGSVVESFTPDFHLPDLDLYIELTTLKQKLVRRKNRKLRRLRELYPDVRIKLFYARDFKMLMLKFGRVALFDELSGSTGQVTPAREAPGDVRDVPAADARDVPAADATPGHVGGGDDEFRARRPAGLERATAPGRRRRHARRRRRVQDGTSPAADASSRRNPDG